MEKECIVRYEEDRLDAHTEDQEAVVAQQMVLDALRDQLRNKDGTLRQVRTKLTVVTSELETMRLRAKNVEEDVWIAQTDVSLQTTLQKKA